jgi:hypothetical protein
MEEERTFGVEIELTSTLSRMQLADVINVAFRQANFTHTCIHSMFVRCTDGGNYTQWIAKTDGSIRTNPDHPLFINCIELVSPVLQGEAGLAQLKVVCDAIKPYVKVNKSCGLHVHHGMKPGDNLGNILMAWARSEKVIYECLPVSRKTGHFARPVAQNIGNDSPPQTTLSSGTNSFKRWVDNKLPGRYWGLNLASIWIRNTVEVRCAAGTHEYTKIANWVRVTQRLIAKGSIAPDVFTHTSGIQDFVTGLKEGLELAERTELVTRAVQSIQQGNTQWLPRRNTPGGYAFFRLLEATEWVARSELVTEMVITFSITRQKASWHISEATTRHAPRAGCSVSKSRSSQRLRILMPTTTEVQEVTETVVHPAVNLDAANVADQDAFRWLQERHERFSPLHRAAGY